MKEDENGGRLSLQLMKVIVLAESSVLILFHRDLSAPAMSTAMSQVGVTLFPSFQYIFYQAIEHYLKRRILIPVILFLHMYAYGGSRSPCFIEIHQVFAK